MNINTATRKCLYHKGVVSEWWKVGGINPTNCLAAYQPLGAYDYESSKVNIANPGTYNATAADKEFAWDCKLGWIGNKVDTCLTTNIYPSSGDLTWSMIVRASNLRPIPYDFSYEVLIGDTSGLATNFAILHRNALWFKNGDQYTLSLSVQSGVFAVAYKEAYLNGVKVGDIGATNFQAGGYTILIGARYTKNTWVFGGEIQAAAIYDTALTAPQVAALTAAMNAL